MNRLSVLQEIVNRVKAKTYLEIGVETGAIISNIDVPRKIGVDPNFILSKRVRFKRLFGLVRFSSFKVASNVFFEEYARNTLSDGIDVAFIDGLHTYKQSLLDVENCLRYLNPKGVIVIHDCNPGSYASAYPAQSFKEAFEMGESGELTGWNRVWNGDVWKTIAHLRVTRDDLNIFTLDLDWGLGIVTKGSASSLNHLTVEEIEKADYWLLEKDRSRILNLKHPKYLAEFIRSCSSSSSTPTV